MKRYNVTKVLSSNIYRRIAPILNVVLCLVSIASIGAIVVNYGYNLDSKQYHIVHQIYRYAWWIYFISFFLQLTILWHDITRKKVLLTTIVGITLILSSLPRIFPTPPNAQWCVDLWYLLGSVYFTVAILSLISIMELSKAIVRFINKRTNPALLMAVCFIVIIGFGTLLLLLPRSTMEGIQLPLVDALFTATSAVCVTGLTTLDIASTFTTEGQIVIIVLIQIGGLGVMTITSFFAMFFMGNVGLFNQIALRDMVGSNTLSSLISTLLHILFFTFIIEGIGALLIWLDIHSTMGMELHEEIFFSIFHAISAFCNAGFSTLPDNLGNISIITGHNCFYLVITLLIILGGLGYPILINFKQVILYHIKPLFKRRSGEHHSRYMHLTNINTKIVLIATTILIVVGTLFIAFNEWNNTLAGMPTADRVVHSLFNAVSPRTAGFNSVDISRFSTPTLLLYMAFMWIGGGAQSTAGGIKVNTFVVAAANILSVIKGRNSITMYNRELTTASVKRASAIVLGSIISIFTFFMILLFMEPHLPAKGLLFETISAFCTVGASLNITPLLGDDSKVLVSILMFIGRVGLITILMSLVHASEAPKYRFPEENIIMN